MIEVEGNLWDYWREGYWLVITTSGTVKKDGACVMGRGIAAQVKNLHPSVPFRVGAEIKTGGNVPVFLPDMRMATFPVKHAWYDKTADLYLIQKSAELFVRAADQFYKDVKFAMPRMGCGNGNLAWELVRGVVAPILKDARFTVVEYGGTVLPNGIRIHEGNV